MDSAKKAVSRMKTEETEINQDITGMHQKILFLQQQLNFLSKKGTEDVTETLFFRIFSCDTFSLTSSWTSNVWRITATPAILRRSWRYVQE